MQTKRYKLISLLLMAILLVSACAAPSAPADTSSAEEDSAAESTDDAAEESSEAEATEEEVAEEEDSDETGTVDMSAGNEVTECAEDLTGETITLHQQAGREGPLAAILGEGFALATADAVSYINEDGGVCGAEIEVEFCETNYNVELEVSCYEEARGDNPIVLFSYGSGATIALKDRVVEDEIVHLVAGLNAEAIYNPRNGYTVGGAPIYSDQFAGFITWLSDNWADIKPEGAGDEIIVGVIGWANAYGAGATTPEALAVAEELGVTVLELEEQALSPDADVTGQLQNMLLNSANVIYNQNLSFSTSQVIGGVRALGVWDTVIVAGVNWSFNVDVVTYLGENAAAANGYYGVFPFRWYTDTDLEAVQLASAAFDAGGYPETERATTYLTTWSQFLAMRDVLVNTVNEVGLDGLDGAAVMATMQGMGIVDGGGVSKYDVRGENRAPNLAQIRQMQWDGEQINFEVVEDFFELPDTRPAGE